MSSSEDVTRELVVVENRQSGNFDVKIGRFFFEEDKYINVELICANNIGSILNSVVNN